MPVLFLFKRIVFDYSMPMLAEIYVLPVCIVSQAMAFLQFCLPFFFIVLRFRHDL